MFRYYPHCILVSYMHTEENNRPSSNNLKSQSPLNMLSIIRNNRTRCGTGLQKTETNYIGKMVHYSFTKTAKIKKKKRASPTGNNKVALKPTIQTNAKVAMAKQYILNLSKYHITDIEIVSCNGT